MTSLDHALELQDGRSRVDEIACADTKVQA